VLRLLTLRPGFSEFSEFFWGHECFSVGVRAIIDCRQVLADNHKKIRGCWGQCVDRGVWMIFKNDGRHSKDFHLALTGRS